MPGLRDSPTSSTATMSDTEPTVLDQTRQRIAELEAELATSQATKDLLAERLAQAQNRAPAPAPAPAPQPAVVAAPRAPRPSVNPPAPFDGTRSKGKAFLRQAYLYMRSRPNDYPDDGHKVLCILSYMTSGSAATWAGQVTSSATIPMTAFSLQARANTKLV